MVNNINPITKLPINDDTAWVNFEGKELKMEEIDNEYLENICKDLSHGVGWDCITTNKDKINAIYQEAYDRNLYNKAVIFNLHTWALCVYGFCDNWPSWWFSPENTDKEVIENDSDASN